MFRFIHNPSSKPFRKTLRKQMPPAEVMLWQSIRNRQLGNLKFRRQVDIQKFIVDFYCAERHLVIELDGDSHAWDDRSEKDILRDKSLHEHGFHVLRFTNEDIYNNLEGVLIEILRICGNSSPSPSSQRGGEVGKQS